MNEYKDLKDLEEKAILNNGSKVNIWNDDGIKVNNKIYRMFEYGDINGHCYVVFINKKGSWKYGQYYPNANYLTIEYYLRKDNHNNKQYLFEFIKIKEHY